MAGDELENQLSQPFENLVLEDGRAPRRGPCPRAVGRAGGDAMSTVAEDGSDQGSATVTGNGGAITQVSGHENDERYIRAQANCAGGAR